jgi:thiol-disulfide isomerase/thioredoxin
MSVYRLPLIASLAAMVGVFAAPNAQSAELEQALGFSPIQKFVEYTLPAKADIPRCTIRAEKENGSTAWIVRDPQGQILRRFADTNRDDFVDLWCYYLDGVEVYRDIDSDFNRKADQYRWFNTGGTRWAIDRDENGAIDAWQVISPHEVAEQLVLAIKNRDQARFNLLLLTPRELSTLGFSKQRADNVAASVQAAGAGFAKYVNEQKLVTAESKYVDFGSSRPGTVPAGTAGSTKDVTILENASALVQSGAKHEQLYLGTLLNVGETWKLIELPTANAGAGNGGALVAAGGGAGGLANVGGTPPTEEMQKIMNQLEQLDKQANDLPPERFAANVSERADLLIRLAETTPDAELKGQWHRQLADMLAAAVQGNGYKQGLDRLEQLRKRLEDSKADEELISHVVFQQMLGAYVSAQQVPGADTAKLQEKWLADLESFVKSYPKSSDAPEAMLQLGMYQEFVGKSDSAQNWYTQIVRGFPEAPPAVKARGAIARLTAVGKPMRLKGQDVAGAPVDLAAYRRKIVLIHYWATWCDPCKADMILLKDYHAKQAGGDFDIIGVCLDMSTPTVRNFLAQNRLPWKHIHEPGGQDGPIANEMGVMTLPLMVLVDQQGNVVNNNIHVAELDAEIAKLRNVTADSKPGRSQK